MHGSCLARGGGPLVQCGPMWNPFAKRSLRDRGEQYRRAHEIWLTHAFRTGAPHPRIPKREASRGGFDPILRTAGGKLWARQWWSETFNDRSRD